MFSRAQKQRLDNERILWLTTVRADGQPQTSPVWFVQDRGEILVWSLEGQRVKNLAHNARVSAHVNDDGRGGAILTIEGTAAVDHGRGPAKDHAGFVERYQPFLDEYDWTWDSFCGKYRIPLVISPETIRGYS